MLLSGWYQAGNGYVSVASALTAPYTRYYHFAAKPTSSGGINAFPNGTPTGGYLSPEEIAAFRQRPPGKDVLFVLKDNDGDDTAFRNATTPGMISTFVPTIRDFVNNNGYSGVSLDWEKNVVKSQYIDLLDRLRTSLGNNKLIFCDVGDWESLPDVAAASQSLVNGFNVMFYDLDGTAKQPGGGNGLPPWHNCSLFAGSSGQRSCDTRLAAFTRAGVALSKIHMGVPLYVRMWSGTSNPLAVGSFTPNTRDYRLMLSDPDYVPANMRYDTAHKVSLLVPSDIRYWSYLPKAADIAAFANGMAGVATFCLSMEDAPFSVATALQAAITGPIIPIPPPQFPCTVTTRIAADGVTATTTVTRP